MVHYLERIPDHGVAIGGRTVFLVAGERTEDTMRQYRERRFEDPGEYSAAHATAGGEPVVCLYLPSCLQAISKIADTP